MHLALDVLRGSNRCAQNCDALWLPSVWSQRFHVLGDNAGMVPRLRFALPGISISGCPQHVPDTICPRSGRQGVLKRPRALCFEHRHELLCECSRHQTSEGTSGRDSPDPTVRLRQCRESRSHQSRRDLFRDLRLRERRACSEQQLSCVTLIQKSFKCSYVHPPGPGEEPRGALLRLVRNVGLSRITGLSGSNSNTSCDKGRTTSWSRLR